MTGEHPPSSNEDLIAELEAAAGKWVLEKNKYTLESLRDARKAVLKRMHPDETSEREAAQLDRAYCDGAQQAAAMASARIAPAELMRQAFVSYLVDTGASPDSHPWHYEKIEAYEACAPETSEPAALRRAIQRHVRWREKALAFLHQVIDGRGTEDEWPALAEFLERSESRMIESTSEKATRNEQLAAILKPVSQTEADAFAAATVVTCDKPTPDGPCRNDRGHGGECDGSKESGLVVVPCKGSYLGKTRE